MVYYLYKQHTTYMPKFTLSLNWFVYRPVRAGIDRHLIINMFVVYAKSLWFTPNHYAYLFNTKLFRLFNCVFAVPAYRM